MRYLIEKLLNEHVDSEIIFKVLKDGYKINLNEHIMSYVPKESREKFKSHLSKSNPFQGTFVDKITGKENIVTFKLNPTDHFINRLYRQRDPDYKMGGSKYDNKIVNPGITEGIDLLLDNSDKLAEQISIGRIKDGDTVEVSSKGRDGFSMIIKFDKEYGKKNVYIIELTTQIKGVPFYHRRNRNKLSLPTFH